jgi:N-acetylmuramoyl-L-alanine amidase
VHIRPAVEKSVLVPVAIVLLFSLVFVTGYHFVHLPQQQEIAVLARQVGQRIIVIDPGHGGFDGGAKGVSGVTEEEVVLAIGRHLAEHLRQVGAKVFLTRDSDEELAEDKVEDLDARCQLAEEVGADIFISIHANSFPSPYEFGAQTFYTDNHLASEQLAVAIQNVLVEGIDVLGYNYREAMQADYYILRQVTRPAVLIEVGFLSNPREELLLNQPVYQQKLAWCIFVGIVRFFTAHAYEEGIGEVGRIF